MNYPAFFKPARVMLASDVAALDQHAALVSALHDHEITSLASIDKAREHSLVFADSKSFNESILTLPNCTLICMAEIAERVPAHVSTIIAKRPQALFARAGRALFPDTVTPRSFTGTAGVAADASVSATAVLEDNITVERGAVIGDNVEIGSGSVIGPGAIIGANCKIGRECVVGPNASIINAFLGNRVLIQAGARIGQDGFGFIGGERGLEKMPHVGRVIIQDDVEIGSNTTVDRGALSDTVVGEGTKIDNLVQIAHNVRIGRHCVITGHCGLSGSVVLGDRVMLGGRVGIADHVTIGDGAQIAAASGVMNDVPAGERWAGAPAQPIKEFFREVALIRNLVREKKEKKT